MKKIFATLTVLAMFSFGSVAVMAQEAAEAAPVAEEVTVDSAAVEAPVVEAEEVVEEAEGGIVALHKTLKTKFIEGGAGFMSTVALCLILGLAIAIERIIYLSLATTNSKKLLASVENALENEGLEAAKEICRNSRGPIASIFYQGLLHAEEGLDVAEKSIIAYGSVQSGLMEKNLSWIGLFIGLCPNFGFMGTVIGMIEAFDRIQQAGDMSATIVAGGIKVALITTVFGLIGAIILQIFYNFILARIEAVVADMEDSSITMLDILTKFNLKK